MKKGCKRIKDLTLSDFRKVKLRLNGVNEVNSNSWYWKLKIGNLLRYKELSFISELRCFSCGKKDIRDIEFHHVGMKNGNQKGGCSHQQKIKKQLQIKGYWKKLQLLCASCHAKYHKNGYEV